LSSETDRPSELRRFAQSALGNLHIRIERASEDASFRSYWRITPSSADDPACLPTIVMDAPPGKEDLGPWLEIGARLRHAGLHAPEIIAVDRERGFVMMEDLGTRTYLPELDPSRVDALYADALDALLRMQTGVDVAGLPDYSHRRLLDEMALCPPWLLVRHLGVTLSEHDRDVIDKSFEFLAAVAAEQPRAFVHRDYHSRNLLIVDAQGDPADEAFLVSPGIVDFQDGVVGPVTYDLVSLLRDCYVEWEAERVQGWMEAYALRLRGAHLIGAEVDPATFARWFDLMGLQRHIKVLGIFCRLWYRDGKSRYLADLPLVWRYTLGIAHRYPELGAFADLLERTLGDRDISAPREQVQA
jgi:aminoglycoside/choline kinase family phosphotransferase